MIKIQGYSDDLIDIEGSDHEDEIYCYDKGVRIRLTNSSDDGIELVFHLDDQASWVVTVKLVSQHIPWPIIVTSAENGYSVMVQIGAPSDTELDYWLV